VADRNLDARGNRNLFVDEEADQSTLQKAISRGDKPQARFKKGRDSRKENGDEKKARGGLRRRAKLFGVDLRGEDVSGACDRGNVLSSRPRS